MTMGLKANADGSGAVQVGGSDAITITSGLNTTFAAGVSGTTFSGTTASFSGNMSFNSGYGSSAVAYGCRAWVNFAGATGTINSSGGVSSVTRSATGTYTVNFSITFPDTNYAVTGFARNSGGTGRQIVCQTSALTTYSTTAVGIVVGDSGGLNDVNSVSIAVFR